MLEQKEQLTKEIFYAGIYTGKPFEKEVKMLISIKGITPLSALAFLSDVGDVSRFKTTRKMNTYLGLVPKLKESGDSSHAGHINRASLKNNKDSIYPFVGTGNVCFTVFEQLL